MTGPVFNAGLNMAGSWYAATANPFDPAPRLQGDVEADLCVIGGGFTGLSAALHAAERGYSVVLLEAGRIGWGASGRNGGQMIPGWRKDARELARLYGQETARRLFDLTLEARRLAADRIAAHDIACDFRPAGHLLAAVKPADLADMRREADFLNTAMDYPHARVLDAAETAAETSGRGHCGGLLDGQGGHLHPLNYALGLAAAARAAGVRLFEHSRVLAIDGRGAGGVRARTGSGAVRARFGVLACDALLGGLEPMLARRIMPVASYVGATEPLARPEAVIARDRAVSDSRFVVNYFRLTPDGRLLFGGGERYTPRPPRDIPAFVRGRMLKVFPHLAGARIDHAWGGLVSITVTRMPHMGRIGELFFAHGYSGQGVLLAGMAGKVLAEAMAGHAERLDLLSALAPPPFPGPGRCATRSMCWPCSGTRCGTGS